jgi:hypothetical protein
VHISAGEIQHVSFEELAVPLFDQLHHFADWLTRSTFCRHPSEIRTGCANQRPLGSVQGGLCQVVSLPTSPIIHRIQADRDAQTRSLTGVLPIDDKFLTTRAEYLSSLRSLLLKCSSRFAQRELLSDVNLQRFPSDASPAESRFRPADAGANRDIAS